MPASNACLIGFISVTVSATAINSWGAPRPVMQMLRSRGFVDDRVYHLFHRQVTVAQRDVEFIQNHE